MRVALVHEAIKEGAGVFGNGDRSQGRREKNIGDAGRILIGRYPNDFLVVSARLNGSARLRLIAAFLPPVRADRMPGVWGGPVSSQPFPD